MHRKRYLTQTRKNSKVTVHSVCKSSLRGKTFRYPFIYTENIFSGRIISSSWAISKSKYCEKLKREATETVDDAEDRGTSEDVESSKKKPEQELDASQKEALIKKQERRKSSKEKSRKKRARIVIRNLAFHVR